jgi:hypothetical protein
MTGEQRLDRLERIVKLMIKAGVRARQQSREQDEKINILIDMQMRSEERLRRDEERLMKNEEGLVALSAKTDERFAAMAAAQASLDETLKSFMATVERIITERRNGKP